MRDCRSHVYYTLSSFKFSGREASRLAGIDYEVFCHMTGYLYVDVDDPEFKKESKINIGLVLKQNKRNQGIVGYAAKRKNVWMYSKKAVEVAQMYRIKFPEVVEALSSLDDFKFLSYNELQPKLSELGKFFLGESPFY